MEHAGRILSVGSQNLRFVDNGTAVDDTKTVFSPPSPKMNEPEKRSAPRRPGAARTDSRTRAHHAAVSATGQGLGATGQKVARASGSAARSGHLSAVSALCVAGGLLACLLVQPARAELTMQWLADSDGDRGRQTSSLPDTAAPVVPKITATMNPLVNDSEWNNMAAQSTGFTRTEVMGQN